MHLKFIPIQEAEEKRKRLEEAEKKRQAMMQAQKDKQSTGGSGKGGQKKADGGVSIFHFIDASYDLKFSQCHLTYCTLDCNQYIKFNKVLYPLNEKEFKRGF